MMNMGCRKKVYNIPQTRLPGYQLCEWLSLNTAFRAYSGACRSCPLVLEKPIFLFLLRTYDINGVSEVF
jgi:hypothetical protein